MSSEDFKSLIVTDPDLVDEGIDVSGLRTTTDTSPYLLGNIPDYSGIQYSTLAPTKYTDLMRLYSQGLPTIDTSQPATPPSGGGGGGSGDGGQATNFDPVSTPIDNTFIGGGATLEDAGGTYDGYQSAEGGFEYTGTPTSDPFLASGAAGGERLPSTSPQEGFLASGAAGGANLPTEPQEGFLASGAAGGANLPTQTYANTGDPNLLDLAGGEAGGADGFGIIEDVVTEQDLADNTSLLQKLGLPADFDIKRAAIEAGINLVAGVPITLIAKGLEAILPDRDPRQNKLDEFYSTGEGAEYMSPTLPDGSPNPNYIPGMENYNTVSGNPLDPTFGLQEAYQDRIDTIENTLANKYGMTAAEIADVKAGSYTGDVDSDLLDRLVDLGDAKKKEQDILGITEGVKTGIQAADDDKGSDMLTTTPTGVNPFADIDTGVGEFDTTPVTGVTQPGTGTVLGKEGIDKFDDAETSIDMFDTTPVTGGAIPPGEKGGPGYVPPAGTLAGDYGNAFEDYNIDISQDAATAPTMTDQIGTFDADTFDDTVGSKGPQQTTTELTDSDFTAQDKQDIFNRETELENQYMEETGKVPTESQFLGQAINEIVDKKTTVPTSVTPLEDDFDFDEIQTYEPPSPPTGTDRPGGDNRDDNPAPSAPAGVDAGTADVQDYFDDYSYSPSEPDDTPNPGDTDTFNRETGSDNSSGSTGGGCCFIMLESRYGDGTMDKVVRRYRDEKMTPRNRRGYYKMAVVLVPLMRKSKVFKWIVTKTFADPLVSYGKWYYGENKHGWIFAPVKTAWLKIFDVVGTDTVFIRENGEEV